MSKGLSRVRALVSEIDSIQNHGRKTAHSTPFLKPVQAEPSAPMQVFSEPTLMGSTITQPVAPSVSEPSNVLSMESSRVSEAPVQAEAPEGKVFIQLTGKIAIQLQLEHTEEIVEVRQLGETIEIRFTDGKAIHLPLKSVA